MRSTQEIFDLIIEKGLYDLSTWSYMCPALREAESSALISEEERSRVKGEILSFMRHYYPSAGTATSLLDCLFLSHTNFSNPVNTFHFPLTLAIYSDWENRFSIVEEWMKMYNHKRITEK